MYTFSEVIKVKIVFHHNLSVNVLPWYLSLPLSVYVCVCVCVRARVCVYFPSLEEHVVC